MTGSEKQIKWAEDIIANAYKAIEAMKAEYDRLTGCVNEEFAYNTLKYNKADVDVVKSQLDTLIPQITDAGMLIEKRNAFTHDSLKKIAIRNHK